MRTIRETRGPALDGGLHTILVATDFSIDGEQAIHRATQLALALDATIVLVHVLPGHFDQTVDSLIRSEAERALDRAAAQMGDRLMVRGRPDVRVRVRLARGNPAVEIARVAESNDAELIVVGRRGHTPLVELLIGSTASQLLRHGGFPVLVATRAPRAGYHNVVIGFDQSQTALTAARLAQRLLPAGVTIRVVHAYEDQWRGVPPAFLVNATPEQLGASIEPLERRAERIQEALEQVWPRDDFRIVVEEADPRKLVLEVAREAKADLVVLGSRGLSGIARMTLGSVAESVLHRTAKDVLIVPATGVLAGAELEPAVASAGLERGP